MKFYDIDNALQEAIEAADKPVRLKIEVDMGDHFEAVFEQDIIEADFYSIKEVAGGVSSRAEILLDNRIGVYSCFGIRAGTQIRVSFSLGEGLPFFQRFIFYVDTKGLQDIKGNGRRKFVRLSLRDLSYKLRKTDEARDWSNPAVFTYSVICDKSQPNKSLVHGIAKRAGLEVTDIDCSTIPLNLPYVRLRRNIWAELSSLAVAYRCHLECAVEKPLIFAHSPYQAEPITENDYSYTFSGNNIFYFRTTELAEQYRNTVRLKINLPVSLEKQEIWRYSDPPVFYNNNLQPYYPFKDTLIREIENGNYEAKYRIIDENGKERNVIYADYIDTKEEAENRFDFDEGDFSYSQYDITTNHDKAILKIDNENDGDLYSAAIYGRPIVLDLNRSCFIRDLEAVEQYGTVALNVTGAFFSEDVINTINGIQIRQYEDWVSRELADRIQGNREFTIKTHRAVFHSRVGAKIKLEMRNEELAGVITSLTYKYKRDKAFIAAFKIKEEEI